MYKNTDWLTQTEQTSFFSKTCFRISILACIWIAVQHVPFVTRPLNNPNFKRHLRIRYYSSFPKQGSYNTSNRFSYRVKFAPHQVKCYRIVTSVPETVATTMYYI